VIQAKLDDPGFRSLTQSLMVSMAAASLVIALTSAVPDGIELVEPIESQPRMPATLVEVAEFFRWHRIDCQLVEAETVRTLRIDFNACAAFGRLLARLTKERR